MRFLTVAIPAILAGTGYRSTIPLDRVRLGKIGAYSLQARKSPHPSLENQTPVLIEVYRAAFLHYEQAPPTCSGHSWMQVEKYDWYTQRFCAELYSMHVAEQYSVSTTYEADDTDGKASHIICKPPPFSEKKNNTTQKIFGRGFK